MRNSRNYAFQAPKQGGNMAKIGIFSAGAANLRPQQTLYKTCSQFDLLQSVKGNIHARMYLRHAPKAGCAPRGRQPDLQRTPTTATLP